MTRAAATRLPIVVLLCVVVSGCGPAEPPDPSSDDVTAARSAAVAQADDELDGAVEALDASVVGTGSDDACYEGQNNWKVHDGYDHRCTVRRVVAVTFDGDFRQRIASFDERLFARGWGCRPSPCRDTNAGLVAEYWPSREKYYGTPGFPISTLPTAVGYEKDDVHLDVRYAGTARGDAFTIENWHRRRRGGLFESFRESRPLPVDVVVRRSNDARYLVLLAVEKDYYER